MCVQMYMCRYQEYNTVIHRIVKFALDVRFDVCYEPSEYSLALTCVGGSFIILELWNLYRFEMSDAPF